MYYIYDNEIWYEEDKSMLIETLVDDGEIENFEEYLDDNYTPFEVFDTIDQNGDCYGINTLYDAYHNFCDFELEKLIGKCVVKVVNEVNEDDGDDEDDDE